MPDVQLFTNRPQFCQKPLTVDTILDLPTVMMNTEANPDTSSQARCGDPNLGTLIVKNLHHKYIRCAGKKIDLDFMMQMYPSMGTPEMVDTKVYYDHYVCDINFNVYVANFAQATAAGQPFTFTLQRSNHGGNGTESYPAVGYTIIDKDNQIFYEITAVDKSVNFAHRVTVRPYNGSVQGTLRPNTAYLISPARIVGGCGCMVLTNSLSSIGYARKRNPIRVRRDWELCVDLLTGYENKLQFMIIYDKDGNPVDAWDIKQKREMREGIQAALNLLAFIGEPISNQSIISGTGASVDSIHTGFYGLVPTLKYGGGNQYNYASDKGFDMEADGEPIFLYQDSRKQTKNFTVMAGLKFMFNIDDRVNNLVKRTDLGSNVWEAFREVGQTDADLLRKIGKLGVSSYEYRGFGFDFKVMDSWSDYRYVGADVFNGMAIFAPQDGMGISENGNPIQPIEFTTYGQGQWTGRYEEHFIDYRNAPGGCNNIGGWAAESMSMAVHCPDKFIIALPVKSA